jgi:hypothetical protein
LQHFATVNQLQQQQQPASGQSFSEMQYMQTGGGGENEVDFIDPNNFSSSIF